MKLEFGDNYTMEEAARWLRISRRKLQDVVKRHPLYYPNGNRKLFAESDLVALREAIRRESCRSSSFRPARAKRHSGPSVGHTSASMWTEAQSLLSKPKRER